MIDTVKTMPAIEVTLGQVGMMCLNGGMRNRMCR